MLSVVDRQGSGDWERLAEELSAERWIACLLVPGRRVKAIVGDCQ